MKLYPGCKIIAPPPGFLVLKKSPGIPILQFVGNNFPHLWESVNLKKYFLLRSSLYFFQNEINEKAQKITKKIREWLIKTQSISERSASNSIIFSVVLAARFGTWFPTRILLWGKMKLKISTGKLFPWGEYLPDIFLLSAFNSHDRQNKTLHSPCYIQLNFQKIIRTLSWVRFSFNHQKRFWDSWGRSPTRKFWYFGADVQTFSQVVFWNGYFDSGKNDRMKKVTGYSDE